MPACGGNAARWINHACNPNCESDIDEEHHRVFIKALRKIKPGEELFYDYGLVIDEPYTRKLKNSLHAVAARRDCRGTMLAPKAASHVSPRRCGCCPGRAGGLVARMSLTPESPVAL